MFLIFPEYESISEQNVNGALLVHTTLQNSALTKKYIKFNFRHVRKLSIGFKFLQRPQFACGHLRMSYDPFPHCGMVYSFLKIHQNRPVLYPNLCFNIS